MLKACATLVLLPFAGCDAAMLAYFNPLVAILFFAIPLAMLGVLWRLKHPLGVVLMLALVAALCAWLALIWFSNAHCQPGACR